MLANSSMLTMRLWVRAMSASNLLVKLMWSRK